MMSNDLAMHWVKQLLWNAAFISSPLVLVTLMTGLVVSILQAATQIQDNVLATIPKLFVATVILMLCGGWMLQSLVTFTKLALESIPKVLS